MLRCDFFSSIPQKLKAYCLNQEHQMIRCGPAYLFKAMKCRMFGCDPKKDLKKLKKDEFRQENHPEKECPENGSPFLIFLESLPAELIFIWSGEGPH